jgi:hypothetical protein
MSVPQQSRLCATERFGTCPINVLFSEGAFSSRSCIFFKVVSKKNLPAKISDVQAFPDARDRMQPQTCLIQFLWRVPFQRLFFSRPHCRFSGKVFVIFENGMKESTHETGRSLRSTAA